MFSRKGKAETPSKVEIAQPDQQAQVDFKSQQEKTAKKKKKTRGTAKMAVTLTALLFLMWGYVLFGATVFTLIEGYQGENYDLQAERFRLLFTSTDKLRALHETDFSHSNTTFEKEAEKILRQHEIDLKLALKKQEESTTNKWTYDSALLFAATLVTSVGYGNIVPQTSVGRLFTIAYSCIGIPLTLICIGMLGTIMARGFKAVAAFLFEDVVTEEGEPYIPLKVSLGIMFSYLFLGAVLFRTVGDNWTFLESFYFCFITLSTIGLGDFVYGESATHDSNFLASVAYILFGLSMLSMCFSLIQEQASYKMHRLISLIIHKSQKIKNAIDEKCIKKEKK